jgi:DNA-binding response OmpR family regulator
VACFIIAFNDTVKKPIFNLPTTIAMSKRILIIEDDPDILEMMAYILQDEGYGVTASVDCGPLEEIASVKPDLILMDNRLGGNSGAEACKKLKTDAATAHIPVILVSANMHLQDLTTESLADGYLTKPFDLEELVAVVRHHLV